jgi:aerobic-type carbon monoxide dehydrogenase small subunit (CoxS/CutS family)
MGKIGIHLSVNGKEHELEVEPYETLLNILRDRFGLTGTKCGCGEGECGACTVMINGKAVLSCMTLGVQAEGKEILTIEGLQEGPRLHPLQETFVEHSALQCGYCTPGMIMAAKALLDQNQTPSEGDVREAISNNLCRCTGYEKPVKAILGAAESMKEQADGK